MSKQKRKRATSAAESPRVKKLLNMHGSKEDCDPFEFRGSSDAARKMGSRTSRKKSNFKTQVEVPKEVAVTTDMPPPSTKPASGELTRSSGSHTISTVVDPLSAKDVLSDGTHAESNPAETPPSFETPFSDGRMPTPTVSSRGRSGNIKASSREEAEQTILDSISAALQTRPGSIPQQEPSSSASLISPSKTITVGRVTTAATRLQDGDLDADELSRSSPIFHVAGTMNPIVLLPERAPDSERYDKVTQDVHNGHDEQIPPDKSKKRKKVVDGAADELDSDNIVIEIPKERYQPRPSRSRAGLETEELVAPGDFSKKPEATVKPKRKRKRKAKRSMPTAFQEILPPKDDDEEEEDEDIQVKARFKKDVPKRQDRPPKSLLEIVESDENPEEVEENPATETEPVIEEQPPKKQRGRPKKANKADDDKNSTTVVDEPVHEPTGKEKAKSIKTTKKLGKKGKEISAALVHEDEEDQDSHGETEAEPGVEDSVVVEDKVLEESTGNTANAQVSEDPPESDLAPKEITAPPETPKKHLKSSEKATEKGPDKHSPISSGKVAYRVGLSKRANIQPLLRIVRK